ncbi:hypothetical protein F120042H4_12170 [Faecalimonas umbilicata]|uniref:restriction endonuclease subunit S n=1 Tax=Faecalimonas umbilicata TaxID=1912855 RepID=UPI0036F33CAC
MRLEDVCTVFTDGDWIESKDQSEKGIRLVQTGNIGEGIYLEKESRAKYIPEDTFKRLKCTEIFPGDILVSRLPEPVGRACIIPEKTERMITAVDCTICRPNEALISKDYLCYFMRSNAYYMRLLGNVTGTTRKRISRKNLGNVELKVPTKEEQKTVVERLDCLVKVIDSRTKELQLLDDLIKARFIELFGDPVSNSYGLPEATLSDLGEFGRGVSKHRPRNDIKLLGGKYPLIQTGDVANAGLYITSYGNTYSELGLRQSKMWDKGTLCITIAANIAKTAILEFDACFPDSVVGFIANERTNNIFIHYWFSFFQEILESQAPESAQKNINLKILSELKVIVPEKRKQDEFASFVKLTDKSKFQKYNATILSHNIYMYSKPEGGSYANQL